MQCKERWSCDKKTVYDERIVGNQSFQVLRFGGAKRKAARNGTWDSGGRLIAREFDKTATEGCIDVLGPMLRCKGEGSDPVVIGDSDAKPEGDGMEQGAVALNGGKVELFVVEMVVPSALDNRPGICVKDGDARLSGLVSG